MGNFATLAPGRHTAVFDFTHDGGAGLLKVDGSSIAESRIEHTLPFVFPWERNSPFRP
ncbi:MAG TPA: hypothetical protein VF502_20115 [Stellaceae bacterium]